MDVKELIENIESLNNEMQIWLVKQTGSITAAMDSPLFAEPYRIHNEIDSLVVNYLEDLEEGENG